MRRLLSLFLALTLLLAVVLIFPSNVSAAFPSPSDMGGYENLCLTYTWNPNGVNNGRHTVQDLMPYVAYYDNSGDIKDFFFDSYLFLPCVQLGTSGGSMHYDSTNPCLAVDWEDYIEDTFYPDVNVNALETAFGEAKAKLNAPDKKAGVFLSILYPAKSAGSRFGSLGGRSLNMNKYADRQYAVKWMIDEQLRLYNEAGYENLELVGFYWLEERLQSGSLGNEDTKLFQYASEYLHSLGFKFIWIPYYQSNGYTKWKTLGFDVACMQPNMYWQTTADANRVDNCVDSCNSLGMCVEIELDHKVFSNTEYYNRYLDYLEGCMQGGAMDSIKMYYQGGKTGAYYAAWSYGGTVARSIYDLTYKYAKGTLTQSDIDKYRSDGFEVSDEVDWISIGKDYVATSPYYSNGSLGYQNNDGTELTDGALGTSELDTDWHAFHSSILDSDGRMSVTIDLGKVTSGLTNFLIQFSHINNHGIGDPKDDIKIYISDNGTDFKQIAQPQLEYDGISAYINHVTQPVSARYVKFSFINSTYNFVFCGEAMVGKNDTEDTNPDVSDDTSSDTSSDTSNDDTSEPTTPPDNDEDENVGENVLLNKNYEISGCGVKTTYNANLTDGEAFDSLNYNPSSNWFGFYHHADVPLSELNAPEKIGYAIFDLGSKYTLNLIRMHLINNTSWAIGVPEAINIYVSNDGENWDNSVGMMTISKAENVGYWTEIQLDCSVRYLKVEFILSDHFAFVNEIEAYGSLDSSPDVPTPDIPTPDVPTPDIPTPVVSLGDINKDGIVDSVDYLLVKRHCFSTYTLNAQETLNADIDENNIIDSLDYLLIKRIAFGNYIV